MGKNKSKKRHRSSSSSSSSTDEAEFWRKKCKKMEKKVKKLEKSKWRSSDEEEDHADHVLLDEAAGEILDKTQGNQENNDPNELSTEDQLPADMLKLLGSTPPDKSKLFELNSNLLEIWSSTIINGIPSEVRDELIMRYPPLSNISIMIAPQVNPEIVAAVSEATINRDKKIQTLQKQLSAALSALGRALSDLLKEEKEGGKPSSRIKIIHTISDACRLILDIHNQQSLLRKNILASCLDQDLKKAITESSTDTLLFGKDLGEKIKDARMLKKAAEDIKPKKPSIKQTSSNSRGPLKPRPVGRPTVSGPKFTRRPPLKNSRTYTRPEIRQDPKKYHLKRH